MDNETAYYAVKFYKDTGRQANFKIEIYDLYRNVFGSTII